MVNKKNIGKWVAALRSDDYTQIKGALRTPAGYCCLGVACEVFKANANIGEWNTSEFIITDEIDSGGESGELPKVVQDWLGLDEADPVLTFKHKKIAATVANDDQKHTFHAIADAIERTWLGKEPLVL